MAEVQDSRNLVLRFGASSKMDWSALLMNMDMV
jgi:hypothetical protein